MGPPTKENASCSKGLKHQLKTTKDLSKRIKVEDTPNISKSTKKQRESVEEKSSKMESGQKPKQHRKIPCPMFVCRPNVIHLPRFMWTVHDWTKETASKALAKYNICKRKNVRTAKKKNYHSRHRCPLANCHAIVQHLPTHLKKVQKHQSNIMTHRKMLLLLRMSDTLAYIGKRSTLEQRWEGGS